MAGDIRTIVVEEVEHSPLGASSSTRWMTCPASIGLIASLDDGEKKKAGFAAAEGTAAHQLCETAYEEQCDAWEYIGNTQIDVYGDMFQVDAEMADGVQLHLDFIEELKEKYPDIEITVENTIHSELHPDAFGTADVLGLDFKEKLIIVGDFKYGKGVVCEPDSTQNKEYGYMALEEFVPAEDIDEWKAVLYIIQPRIPHPKGRVRSYHTTGTVLQNWFTEEVIPAMLETENPEALFETGEHCKFCPAKGPKCPAMSHAVQDVDLSVEPNVMTDEEIGEMLKVSAAVKSFMDELEKEAFKRILGGAKIAGKKLVKKQANRAFKTSMEVKVKGKKTTITFDDAVIAKFGDDAYQERKVKTPPNIEKLPEGKNFVTKWAYTPDAGLTLAPTSDKRKEVKPVMEEFMDRDDI